MVSDPVAAVKWRVIEAVWGRLGSRQKPGWTVSSDLYKPRGLWLSKLGPRNCHGALGSTFCAISDLSSLQMRWLAPGWRQTTSILAVFLYKS